MKQMNYTDWHTTFSYIKSVIRGVACVAGLSGSLLWFAVGMLIAECVGIIEEFG